MKVKIELTYQTPKGTEIDFISVWVSAEKALLLSEDFERIGRIQNIQYIDTKDTSWTQKELKNYLKEVETEPHNITVYFDGGHELVKKRAGLGCAIYYKQNGKSFRLRKNLAMDLIESNNEAEYAALYLAIQEMEQMGVQHLPVEFIGDSQVVINQLSEDWPVFEDDLSKWIDRIENKLNKMGITPFYKLVSRKENKEADQLASQALKDIMITSISETN